MRQRCIRGPNDACDQANVWKPCGECKHYRTQNESKKCIRRFLEYFLQSLNDHNPEPAGGLFLLQGKLDKLLYQSVRLCARERILLAVWGNDDAPGSSTPAGSLSILCFFFDMLRILPARQTSVEFLHIKSYEICDFRQGRRIEPVV